MEQVKDNYQLINKNTPLPNFPENIDKNIPETGTCISKINITTWSKNTRARRPHIIF